MRKNIDIPEEIVKDYKKKNVSFRLGANLRARISSALKRKLKYPL